MCPIPSAGFQKSPTSDGADVVQNLGRILLLYFAPKKPLFINGLLNERNFRTKPDGRTKQNIPLENCGLVRIQVGELHHLVHDLANANSVAQLLVDEPLIDWFWLSVRPSLSRNRRNTPSSVDEVGLRPSRSP
jgi:hypothetical protein